MLYKKDQRRGGVGGEARPPRGRRVPPFNRGRLLPRLVKIQKSHGAEAEKDLVIHGIPARNPANAQNGGNNKNREECLSYPRLACVKRRKHAGYCIPPQVTHTESSARSALITRRFSTP